MRVEEMEGQTQMRALGAKLDRENKQSDANKRCKRQIHAVRTHTHTQATMQTDETLSVSLCRRANKQT
jgi:hypothetical protein